MMQSTMFNSYNYIILRVNNGGGADRNQHILGRQEPNNQAGRAVKLHCQKNKSGGKYSSPERISTHIVSMETEATF